jgi:hypothetical protein
LIQQIQLQDRVQGGAALDFLTVEVPVEPDRYVPFALVRYSLEGKPQQERLRLDLDKRTFADHFPNPDQERVLCDAARQIAEIVAEALKRRTYERLRKEFGG